ncbi:response regulator [bacterium]|nr:response regulator [Pelagibaca sp.]MBR9892187.1 response regulator [bacterium]
MTDGDGSKPTVLLCEDEYIVALDLQLLLEEFGYEVIGPFDSFSKGLKALNEVRPDMAVLDVRLRDGEVFPLADKLNELGVGLVFHSGHVQDADIAEKYGNAMCCHKPIDTKRLQHALQKVCSASPAH